VAALSGRTLLLETCVDWRRLLLVCACHLTLVCLLTVTLFDSVLRFLVLVEHEGAIVRPAGAGQAPGVGQGRANLAPSNQVGISRQPCSGDSALAEAGHHSWPRCIPSAVLLVRVLCSVGPGMGAKANLPPLEEYVVGTTGWPRVMALLCVSTSYSLLLCPSYAMPAVAHRYRVMFPPMPGAFLGEFDLHHVGDGSGDYSALSARDWIY